MSQSPITQVSPEGENHAISTLITQVPESKLYSITKPEDKDSAIHSTPSKTISNSTSDISTTLANTSTSSPTSPKSSSSSNLKTTRRISSRFFSLFLCCTLSSRAIISNKEKIVRNINNTVNDNNSNSSNNDDISNPINISTTTGIGNGTTEKQSPSNSSKNNEIDQIDNIYSVTEVKGEGKEIDINWLLDPIGTEHIGRKCLVLDLDETLVHSSFKTINQPDFVIPVDIENQIHNVYVIKRPGVDRFLRKMGELYEVVVFTASLPKYADPVLDMLDIHKVVKHRLFRESCSNHKGNYVKDLSHIGRELKDTIIIDNSPASYMFHPKNAVPISSWFNDPHDTELLDLIPFLEDLTTVDDVRIVLDSSSVPQL